MTPASWTTLETYFENVFRITRDVQGSAALAVLRVDINTSLGEIFDEIKSIKRCRVVDQLTLRFVISRNIQVSTLTRVRKIIAR